MKFTNTQLEEILRDKFSSYSSSTAKLTKENFTERGFTELKQTDPTRLNTFFNLSMRVYLEKIDVAKIKDNLAIHGFGAETVNEYGNYIQRMAVEMIDAVSPAYLNLQDGKSVDPFIVRKPKVSERFFEINAEFQNLITIPDEVVMKQVFISEYGMDELISGIMSQLENSYKKFLYLNKLEALNAGINNTEFPLQETQKIEVNYSIEPTAEELTNIVIAVKNAVSLLDASPSTSAFNQRKFESAQDISRLKFLVRVGFKNQVAVKLLSGSFNPDKLTLPIDIIEVNHFGGLTPFKDAGFKTPLFEVYDANGTMIGYNETENATTVTVSKNAVFMKDPNADLIGVIADKDIVFTSRQGSYSVEPIRNPRGLYTNYWASAPRGTVAYDNLYNIIALSKADPKGV